jgi:hypothetical protein
MFPVVVYETTAVVFAGDPAGKTTGSVTGPPGSPLNVMELGPGEASSGIPAAMVGLMVAVKIIGCPYATGLAEVAREVVLGAGLRTSLRVAVDVA